MADNKAAANERHNTEEVFYKEVENKHLVPYGTLLPACFQRNLRPR